MATRAAKAWNSILGPVHTEFKFKMSKSSMPRRHARVHHDQDTHHECHKQTRVCVPVDASTSTFHC